MAAVTPPRPLAGFTRNRHRRRRVGTDIAGYVALSASQIERAFLLKPQQRNRPDPVPVMLLGQLAVDKGYQRQGHAASLLLFALKSALRASELVGSMGTMGYAASTRDGDFKTCLSTRAAPCWCGWWICSRVFDVRRRTGLLK